MGRAKLLMKEESNSCTIFLLLFVLLEIEMCIRDRVRMVTRAITKSVISICKLVIGTSLLYIVF